MIAVAGMTGTLISLPAMKGLPFGLPKVLVSSAAALPRYADWYAQYFSLNDITVMHSVVDTVGMNAMLRTLLQNGAGAICWDGRELRSAAEAGKPAIAITEYGFAEQCAHSCARSSSMNSISSRFMRKVSGTWRSSTRWGRACSTA